MNTGKPLPRTAKPAAPLARGSARQYAAWFRVLSDPTRVQVVSVLASSGRPLNVSEIVTAVGVSQATVSQHLKVLAGVRFVIAERHGTARHYRLNDACVTAFPSAAAVVTGRMPPAPGETAGAEAAGAEAAGAEAAPAGPPVSGRQRRPAAGSRRPGALVRPMIAADADRVLAIYQAGLDSGEASFETTAPSWERFDAAKLHSHRFVAVSPAGQVIGWAAVSAVSDRCVYAGVVEHSVYVDPAVHRHGAGGALLQELIRSTEAAGIWTIQSGIFPENVPSLRLHEQAGFTTVGIRRRIGCHRGRWRDVVLVERRSTVAGTGQFRADRDQPPVSS